ncbi:uncharacterized protein LOC109846957 [Asparagus officinalis]|uniref:uncharacterized protein LOC109846957 n=1 Tax=Asparagus officinalis TaxID=4686 RepID=UPI00098E4CD9|nr:uncharacterized protein LOC109846957 [Asparagus officinalis]
MDKSWMTLIRDRLSLRYRAGVDAFIEFAKVNAGGRRTIQCPCNKCMNLDWCEFGIVQDHLVRYGIMVSYKIWLHHGELPDNQHGDSGDDRDESDDDNKDEYPELMEDHYRGTYMEDDDVEMDHNVRNFEKLLEASQREMYPGCKNFTLLAFVVKMLHVKVENRWSNKSFDMILQIFRDLLPEGHLVPGSIYETKKLLRDLGMGYEHIDACQHDCVLILMPYNLPPWLCMKESFFMMSLLIPGPHAPGNDIDVFLRPLVDELKELWDNGSTIGYLACPPCKDDPLSHRLRSKIGYFGHRVYLPRNHTMRRSKDFNGRTEHHMKSLELPVEKVLEQLDQLPNVNFGKHPLKRKRPYESIALNWRKKSIFFKLPYWKELKVRHNLDPMHIEKNICEAIIGTILGIDGKNKDTNKARLDLEDMDIRSKLHLEKQPDGSIRKPIAAYTLSPEEREGFCAFLASIKYPDGYAANLSRCVSTRGGKLTGLKSHDYHVLLQRLLPIGMHGYVNKEIGTTLFELGSFFQDLCSKTLRHSDLEKLRGTHCPHTL